MNWKKQTINQREVLTSGDFKIIFCKNGRFQLREGKLLRGTFASAAEAKKNAAERAPEAPAEPTPTTPAQAEGVVDQADLDWREVKKQLGVPRGATHFRFHPLDGKKPTVGKLRDFYLVAGIEGRFEFGKQPKDADFAPLEKAATTPAPRSNGTRGRHRQLMGYSACAVLKALGKAGVKYPEAAEILKRHGIEMPKASVNVQLGFGRNEHTWKRHGQPAQLTDTQVAELRAS